MVCCGRIRAEMAAKQKEAIRKKKVISQCENLLLDIAKKTEECAQSIDISYFFDNSIVIKKVNDAKLILKSNPEDALLLIQDINNYIERAVSSSISKTEMWSREKEENYQKITDLICKLRLIPINSSKLKEKMLSLISELELLKNTATTSEDILRSLNEIESKAILISELDEKEDIRKEIVLRIISVLKEKKFVITKPFIKENVVHAVGKKYSGEIVRFKIHQDGFLDFEHDGYVEHSCSDELDGIIESFNFDDNLKLTREQHKIENPDKIKKGSKEFPYGNEQARYMRK